MHRLPGLAILAVGLSSSPLAAQAVQLHLRPHAGDTLRLRLDQTIETARTTTARPDGFGPGDAASLVILARIAVDAVDLEGANVTAHTDSVRITSSEGFAGSPTLLAARAMQGQQFRFRMLPDGGSMLSGGDLIAAQGIAPLFSQLPATLPREKLAPGATWARSVEIPVAASPDGRATLNATFRFDSLSKSGEYAYLSVKGRVIRSGPVAASAKGAFVQTAGDVSGKILLDLRRGWIADARSVVTVNSLVSQSDRSPATRVRVKITQWMRVL